MKKNGIQIKFQVERGIKQWMKCVLDISDVNLTSTSLDSKDAVSCIINKAFKNFVIGGLHSGMCKKSKLTV